MNDDTKLKIVFYFLVLLFAMAIIGLWEEFIKPLAIFLGNSISILR